MSLCGSDTTSTSLRANSLGARSSITGVSIDVVTERLTRPLEPEPQVPGVAPASSWLRSVAQSRPPTDHALDQSGVNRVATRRRVSDVRTCGRVSKWSTGT